MEVKYSLTLYRNRYNAYSKLYHGMCYEGDSGLDIYVPSEVVVPAKSQAKIKLGIHCSVKKNTTFRFPNQESQTVSQNVGFFLLPRSSISKTPLRMSNSVGLIDAGYRGQIMAPVDNISDEDYVIKSGDRLFQLVNSDLAPFSEIIEKDEDDLEETERGSGGFGSTN